MIEIFDDTFPLVTSCILFRGGWQWQISWYFTAHSSFSWAEKREHVQPWARLHFSLPRRRIDKLDSRQPMSGIISREIHTSYSMFSPRRIDKDTFLFPFVKHFTIDTILRVYRVLEHRRTPWASFPSQQVVIDYGETETASGFPGGRDTGTDDKFSIAMDKPTITDTDNG